MSTKTREQAQGALKYADDVALAVQNCCSTVNNWVSQCVKVQILLSSPDGKGEWVPSRSLAPGITVVLSHLRLHGYRLYQQGHVTWRSCPTVPMETGELGRKEGSQGISKRTGDRGRLPADLG